MLVLTRKAGQSICIGKDIIVTVIEVEGDKVRIGIDAPQSLTILRQELVKAVQQENTEASKISADITAQLLKQLHEE